MTTNKLILIICFFLLCGWLQAQDTEETLVDRLDLDVSGSVDSYFRANLNSDKAVEPGTSFANLPGFSLGMANLVLGHEKEKYGFVADLVFGPRGEDATFLSPVLRPGGSSNIVNQLYAYLNVSDRVTLTMGNFNTFLGYEVISPTGNFNYSTTHMFSNGPFSHTGLKADVDLGSGFSLMAGVFNQTDETEFNLTDGYAGGVQLGYDNNGLGVWLNGLFAEDYTQVDITAGYDVNDELYLGLNATIAEALFSGVAGYVQYGISDMVGLGLRAEHFIVDGGDFDDVGTTNITLSAPISQGNLTIIPELRVDLYEGETVPNDGDFGDSLASFILAAVYSF